MDVYHHLQASIPPFVSHVISSLNNVGIDVSPYFLDHCCYRCETMLEYNSFKSELSFVSQLLTESVIGGRPIATFKLHVPVAVNDRGQLQSSATSLTESNEPLELSSRQVQFIELASPKPGSPYPSGLEHVEFVIDSSLDEFRAKHQNHKWDTKGMEKKTNQDIRLNFNGFSVKFHLDSLENVIALEDKGKGSC